MKKLLSIILATTMIFALLPSFALAADTEGVLDYKITTDALNTAAYPTDTKYALPDSATGFLGANDKTIKNVLLYLADNKSALANTETQFVSYRDAEYQMVTNTSAPIKLPLSSTTGIDTTKTYLAPASLNLSYTAPYELMGRAYCDNTNTLNATGLYVALKTGTKESKDASAKQTALKRRPNYMVRIKIDESQAGKYRLSAYNNFKYTTDGKIEGYSLAYSIKGYHAVPKVSIVNIPSDFEFKHTSAGKVDDATADNNSKNLGTYYNRSTELGYYNSGAGNSDEFDKILDLSAGEYLVIFEINTTSIEKQEETVEYNSNVYQNFLLSGIKLTPAVSEEETAMKNAVAEEVTEEGLSTTATVNVYTRDIDGDTSVESAVKYNPTVGSEFTAQAEDVVGENYEFMYWEKGLGTERRVVSDVSEYKLTAESGATHLTAVYKSKESATVPVIFFNGNGDELSKSTLAENTAITAPTNPTVSGGAQFLGWKLAGDDAIYTSEQVNTMPASGNRMIFVAQFADDKEKKDITITVNDEALAEKKYYGEAVTVNAEETSDNKYFAYWKKGEEVVSFKTSYTFRAWEDCELTAVYSSSIPSVTDALRKIIISGNVAEFIGLDAAVEKGVIFRDTDATQVTLGNATHKIAMTTDGNHLAFINDLENNGKTNCTGYAILANGKVIYDK